MWTAVLIVYAAGLAVTAVVVLRAPVFKKERLLSAGSILLWPFYWLFYVVTLIQNRA